MGYKAGMTETFLTIGGVSVSAGEALAGFACVVLALLSAIAIMLARSTRARGIEAARHDLHAGELEERMAEIVRVQSDTAGRVHTMGEVLSGRQAELARAVSERLDTVTHRLGQSMQQQTQSTMANLAKLNERLAVIDNAQKNLTDLSSQVTRCARCSRTSRRVAPLAKAAWRRLSRTDCRRTLRIPAHAYQQRTPGLRDLSAERHLAADHRREISARGDHGAARRAQ